MRMSQFKIGDFLDRQYDTIELDELSTYKRVTVRTKGQGILLRDKAQGFNIGTKRQFLVKRDQFLLSKIDAMNGAFGIIPEQCDGGIVTGNFWTFCINEKIASKRYLDYLTKGQIFTMFSQKASSGSTNRKYLDEQKFLNLTIPLPPLLEQKRIVKKLDSLQYKINEIKRLRVEQVKALRNMLYSKFVEATEGAEMAKMAEVAPIVRRPVAVEMTGEYPELGIRNFGKGTFHKPALEGIEVGTKKLFTIKENDLLFSNVFAWEGGIAVVQPADNDRVGSHRFLSCVCDETKALPEFLWYYFLSEEGLEKIRLASPGGAGRNRTLGLKKLEKIEIPIPDINNQKEFVQLKRRVEHTLSIQQMATIDLDELMPSLLDKAFKGEF